MIDKPLSLLFHRLCRLLDPLLAVIALGSAWMVANYSQVPTGITDVLSLRITLKNLLLVAVFLLAWHGICRACGVYSFREIYYFRQEAKRVSFACLWSLVPAAMFVATSISRSFHYLHLLLSAALLLSFMLLSRVVLRAASGYVGLRQSNIRRAMIIGSSQRAQFVYHKLRSSSEAHYEIVGFVDNPGDHEVPRLIREHLMGTLPELREILKNHVIDEVFLTLPLKSHYSEIQDAIHACEETGVECRLPSDAFTYSIARPHLEQRGRESSIRLKVVEDNFARAVVKRAIDLLGAVTGLIIFAPVMVAIAIAVRLDGPGPIFFGQQRYGRNRRVFTMWKFRTMVTNAEQLQSSLESLNEHSGPAFKIKNDPRVTPIGRFLRRTSLDELPQFWNVLTGEMSLVGPRPLPKRDVSRFSEAWLMRRFSVKPGLTCLWQISGRSDIDFDRWIELDLSYIDQWSLSLDLEILAKTVSVVVRGQGAA